MLWMWGRDACSFKNWLPIYDINVRIDRKIQNYDEVKIVRKSQNYDEVKIHNCKKKVQLCATNLCESSVWGWKLLVINTHPLLAPAPRAAGDSYERRVDPREHKPPLTSVHAPPVRLGTPLRMMCASQNALRGSGRASRGSPDSSCCSWLRHKHSITHQSADSRTSSVSFISTALYTT